MNQFARARMQSTRLRLGAGRIINLKLGRVGGHAQAKKVEREFVARTTSRCGVAGCSSPALVAHTTSPWLRLQGLPCRAMFQPVQILGRRHYRSSSNSFEEWNHKRAEQGGHRL